MAFVARRPFMPGYGILGPTGGTGLLPWSWAEERLLASHDYWLATTAPDGRPHVTPVWGTWSADRLWFSCGGGSRKARNLTRDARCAITTDDALNPVIIEGSAARESDDGPVRLFTDTINAKYGTDYGVEFFSDNALFAVTPERVFGLLESDFSGSPTCWERS